MSGDAATWCGRPFTEISRGVLRALASMLRSLLGRERGGRLRPPLVTLTLISAAGLEGPPLLNVSKMRLAV